MNRGFGRHGINAPDKREAASPSTPSTRTPGSLPPVSPANSSPTSLLPRGSRSNRSLTSTASATMMRASSQTLAAVKPRKGSLLQAAHGVLGTSPDKQSLLPESPSRLSSKQSLLPESPSRPSSKQSSPPESPSRPSSSSCAQFPLESFSRPSSSGYAQRALESLSMQDIAGCLASESELETDKMDFPCRKCIGKGLNIFGVKCKNCEGGKRRLPQTDHLAWLLARRASSVLRWLKAKEIAAVARACQGSSYFCRGQTGRLLVPVLEYDPRTASRPEPTGVEVLTADNANLVSLKQNEKFAEFMLACCSLRELYSSNNPGLEVSCLGKALQKAVFLEVLDLTHNQLAVNSRSTFKPPQSLEPLIAFLPRTLRVLDLSYNLLRDEHAQLVADAFEERGSGHLEQLMLRSNYLGNSAGFAMSSLMRSPGGAQLWRLDMRTNQVEAEGACAMLTALRSHENMREMRVGYNKTSTKQDLDTADLATVLLQQALNAKSVARLQLLDLNNVRIGDDGLRSMSIALADNRSLRSLCLAFNSIGPDGIQHLARALRRNVELRSLDLRDNDLLDAGAELLAAGLENNVALRTLQVARCSIGSKGALFLMTATRGKTLNVDFGASGFESRILQGIVNRTSSLANLRSTREAERECRQSTRASKVDASLL